MKYKVSSLWAGKYAKTQYGYADTIRLVIRWFISFTVKEFMRVLSLNKYHYGNVFGLGKKLTINY